jgi:hypothetical protein
MLFNRGGKVYMSQDLVRYSPDIERADLDFTQHLGTVLGHLKQNIKTSVEGRGRSSGQGLPGAYAQRIRPGQGEGAEQPLRSPVL